MVRSLRNNEPTSLSFATGQGNLGASLSQRAGTRHVDGYHKGVQPRGRSQTNGGWAQGQAQALEKAEEEREYQGEAGSIEAQPSISLDSFNGITMNALTANNGYFEMCMGQLDTST